MLATQLPALVTLLTVLLIGVVGGFVGRARGTYKIDGPATTGNLAFERVFRAHQNTIEGAVMFLPSLWLAAVPLALGPLVAGVLGLVWVLARAWYAQAYSSGGSRAVPFATSMIITSILLIAGFVGVIRAMLV